ncbi:Presenilin-like membrane protease, A22 family [Dehalogenimonas formicexedens]|uniref:Presenilin-like membrane protease, A22 family n=1 Tax=Dehalogenimonas formicexedens TaxID=1839801 RepID=A0A1P8F9V3_9CHLR|nr:presenilin family intramembrane aspartyl protease [Dehalogenimonas formicexedens]APV45246.1 Presenilin-like membrane protease, A22 family [Dehalogenimonas formicexedens]
MATPKKTRQINPIVWGLLLFVIAQVLTLLLVNRIDPFLDENNIYVPSQPPQDVTVWPGETTLPSGEVIDVPVYSSLGPILIYFAVVVAIVGLVLALIPVRMLKTVLRGVFALVFGWGTFIMAALWLPFQVAIVMALAVSVIWFFIPRVWFHDAALVISFVSLGAVFGRFITPWTGMIIIGALAVYDFVAVKSGFMVWMADKMTQTAALPALVIPRYAGEWGDSIKERGVQTLVQTEPADRKYSIIGGGDISFPCLLTASVYFSQAQGLAPGIIMAIAGTAGLGGAYLIQKFIVKGKPVPALPPIAVCTLIGLFIIRSIW